MHKCGEDNDDDTEVDELFDQVTSEMLDAKEEIPICAEFSETSWSEEFIT